MKNRHVRLIGTALLMLGLVIPVSGGGLKKVAQTGMKWLSIPVGARGSALGGSFTAVVNDASAVFWNPAGSALTSGGHLFLNQSRWIADITLNAGSISYGTKGWGVFGLSMMAVNWGTLHGTRRTSTGSGFEETGEFSPEDWSVGVSYALRVSDKFSFGAHVKYIHENLGSAYEGTMDNPQTYTGEMNLVAFDFGTLYFTGFKDLRFGMTIQNFSQEKKYRAESFPLPLTFRFGVAMDLIPLFASGTGHSMTLCIDADHPRDYSERLHFGGEYSFRNLVFLRAGYKTNYDEEDLSLGGGLLLKLRNLALGLDYAFVHFKNFDSVHMFSFDFKF